MTAPRQLLGWTVPDHVDIDVNDYRVRAHCRRCLETFLDGISEPFGSDHAGQFLFVHAHGQTVERLVEVLPETPEPPKLGDRSVRLWWSPGEARVYSDEAGQRWTWARVNDTAPPPDDAIRIGTFGASSDEAAHAVGLAIFDEVKAWPPKNPYLDGVVAPMGPTPEHVGRAAIAAMREMALAVLPAPQSSPTPLLPLSAPVETEGEAEGDTEALSPQVETELKLWNLLDQAEQEYLGSDEPCDRKSALVRAVLAEGWRPSRTPVPSSQVHVELAKTIAESAGIPQSLAATVASVLIEDEGWRPPLPPLSKVAPFDPDDETPAALAAFFLTPWFDGHARLAAGAARGLDVLGVLTQPVTPLPAVEPALLRRLSDLFASTGRQHPAAWLADAATAAEEGRKWPVLPDKPKYNLVDVYGPNGELLYAGRLKAREDGGWDATPDGALPADEVQWSVRERDDARFYYHPTTDEEDAREEAACREGNTLGKRDVWYGPWVAVPVEPKETK